jgi:hypothetical protein
MKKLLILGLIVITYVLCSCSMPSTSVRTVDDRPTLAFKGAPENAVLFVDGHSMGAANQYNAEPKTLTVEPGTHVVRVTINQDVIFEQRVFVESSLKIITIR